MKMPHCCERFVFWNGYVRKYNQRYGPSCPVRGLKPPSPSPCAVQGIVGILNIVGWDTHVSLFYSVRSWKLRSTNQHWRGRERPKCQTIMSEIVLPQPQAFPGGEGHSQGCMVRPTGPYRAGDAQEEANPASEVIRDDAEAERAREQPRHVDRLRHGLEMIPLTDQVPLRRTRRRRMRRTRKTRRKRGRRGEEEE